jgi:teichoic acid transport system ATP-binding protein
VSHDLGSVARYCSRALWLEAGRVQAIGETEEVVERYAPRATERLGA